MISKETLPGGAVMKFWIVLGAGVAASIFLLSVPFANAAVEMVVYSFCSPHAKTCPDGSDPWASALIDVDGKLFGTTAGGGQFGGGTLFKLDPKNGRVTLLHSFGSADDGIAANGLLNVNGTLYGTTDVGGTYGDGTVFSFDLKTNTETVLHSFGGSGDGSHPEMTVPIEVKGVLYGTTYYGGAYGYGTVFSIDPKSGTETILHSFQNNGSDGSWPWTGLTYLHGMLYGVTPRGGTGNNCGYGCGTLYSVNPRNGVETVLYSFPCEENTGCQPFASLLDYKGVLYGTSSYGVFSFNPQTNVETALEGGENAGASFGALINIHGTLYGTTPYAGGNTCGRENECGEVFSVDPQSGIVSLVYSFGHYTSDGWEPYAGLVDMKGALYGTTRLGGPDHGGIIYKITP